MNVLIVYHCEVIVWRWRRRWGLHGRGRTNGDLGVCFVVSRGVRDQEQSGVVTVSLFVTVSDGSVTSWSKYRIRWHFKRNINTSHCLSSSLRVPYIIRLYAQKNAAFTETEPNLSFQDNLFCNLLFVVSAKRHLFKNIPNVFSPPACVHLNGPLSTGVLQKILEDPWFFCSSRGNDKQNL